MYCVYMMETCVDSQLDCHSIIHNDKIMFYTNRVGQRMGQLGSIPVMVGVELESVTCIDKTRKTVIATLVECLKDIFRDFILWQAGRQGTVKHLFINSYIFYIYNVYSW